MSIPANSKEKIEQVARIASNGDIKIGQIIGQIY